MRYDIMEGALIVDVGHTSVGRGDLRKQNAGHGGEITCYLPGVGGRQEGGRVGGGGARER